ncbi:MAG: HupE/UreJ family protein [Rhodobacteraceae bacterium]|jgi:urease accessory protein|nr:HupE/UreJ family protein [Paracoccaceae bacterium]
MNRPVLSALLMPAALVSASPALAHVDPVAHGLAAGLTHPVHGADHLLAMVAVGLLAVVLGGRALRVLPAAFLGCMAAGYGIALAGIALPLVEPMILASVLALGLLVAFAARLPLGAAAAMVGVFGLAHGAAHGGELGASGALAFGVGFLLATGLLHAAGIALGLAAQRAAGGTAARVMGAAVAVAGGVLAIG